MAQLDNFQELLKELRLPSSIKLPEGWTQVQALQNWLEAIENDKFATFKPSATISKKIKALEEPKDGITNNPDMPITQSQVISQFDSIFE